MSFQYDQYLARHRANVKRGFDWLSENLPGLMTDTLTAGWNTEFAHDQSKNEPDEYEAYDAYFYGNNRSYEVVQKYQRAWLLHIHRNPHHWQHWILIHDDMENGELYPITMPYMPSDRAYKVYTEDFLTDPKNGDYDTVGILYVITPSMEKVEINRYFKEAPKGFAEIDESEYVKRKMKVQWDDLLSSDFKGIKEAFGFELHDWQKKYLKGELDSFPNGRGNGKTFAMNLKALLGDGDTVTFDELKRRHRMSNQECIYVNNILDMNAKLCAAGFTTNIIKRR